MNLAAGYVASKPAGAKKPLNVFTTLARHRRLFRAWMFFAGRLLHRGSLAPADRELLILRVAHNCGSSYEWQQHEKIAAETGLTQGMIEGARAAEPGGEYDSRQVSLLKAADELHRDSAIGDATWEALREDLSEVQLIELCMLVGQYEMIAMTLNSLGTPLEAEPGSRSGAGAPSIA
jgi:alkylhydroperoxidase family enzyme